MKLEFVQNAFGFGRLKDFIQGSSRMSVQVIHHQANKFSFRIMNIDQFLHQHSPILPSAMIGHFHMPPTSQGFKQYKEIGYSLPFVFIIDPLRPTRLCRNGLLHFANQLFAGLIHANLRVFWIIRQLVNVQNIFHASHKLTICLRRNAPFFVQPRLNFCFFSTCRTVS
jgi:hypothetical protein